MPWTMLLIGYLPWFLGVGATMFVGVRIARALEVRGVRREEFAALERRLLELESATTTLGEAVERVEAGERFTRDLLQSRTGEGEARSPRR